MSDHPETPRDERGAVDPNAVPELSPRGGRVLAISGLVLSLLAIVQYAILLGPLGMAAGLVAHLKGDRWGFKVAVVGAVTTIVGMSLAFLLANPFRGGS